MPLSLSNIYYHTIDANNNILQFQHLKLFSNSLGRF